jgi:hypothetical protein
VEPTPIGNLLETTGHGAWKRLRRRRFEAFFRFFLQNADTGAPIGTDTIRLRLALDYDGDTLTGTFVSQIKGPVRSRADRSHRRLLGDARRPSRRPFRTGSPIPAGAPFLAGTNRHYLIEAIES